MRIASLLPVLAVVGGLGAVGVAGAAGEHRVYVGGSTEFCFTTTPDKTTCDPGERADLTIATGDTVTWELTGNWHNAAPQPPEPSTPPDAAWDTREPPLVTGGTDSYTFGRAGVYRFVCQAHPSMVGTITVEGDPVATPTPTPTASPSPTPAVTAGFVPAPAPPPAAPAAADDHTRTPAPGGAAKDAVKPRLTSVRVRRARAGLRLRFRLSEPATVAIKARRKGSRRVLASKVVQAPAGAHSLTLRSRALRRKGSYRVTFAPVDAMANRGATVKRGARVK